MTHCRVAVLVQGILHSSQPWIIVLIRLRRRVGKEELKRGEGKGGGRKGGRGEWGKGVEERGKREVRGGKRQCIQQSMPIGAVLSKCIGCFHRDCLTPE